MRNAREFEFLKPRWNVLQVPEELRSHFKSVEQLQMKTASLLELALRCGTAADHGERLLLKLSFFLA